MNIQDAVRDFHKEFGVLINEEPTLANRETRCLRVELIREELDELIVAYQDENLVEVADALGDLLYVVYGAAVSHGIDLEPIVAEIHRSNMSKVGGHRREDGKWIKPDTYSPTDLAPILESQRG